MRRAIGWRLVLPWSVGLVGLFAAAHLVLAWWIKAEVVRSGERSVGARVEVGDVRVSLLGSRVSLRGVRVANPQAAMRNLIAADRCEFEFEPGALLEKRSVISNGTVTGLRFGTPRETSGVLPGANASDESPFAGWLDRDAAQAAHEWLDKLNDRFDRGLVERLESVRLANALIDRWPQQAGALETRVQELSRRIADFQTEVSNAQKNPLRHAGFLETVPDQAAKIRDEVAALNHAIENLPTVAEPERRAIVAAREHDERLLNNELQFEPIDANVLSAYLLQERLHGPLSDLVGWLRWMRGMVPAEHSKHAVGTKRGRGQDVLFAGCRPTPDLLIRTLQLQGAVRLCGQPLELVGTLSEVSNKPSFHDQPMRLKLAARGSLPFELQATIDRTGPVARDQLLVDCGGIVLPKLRLGGSNKLQLSLAPSTATLNISINLEGDRLSGDIQLVQRQVQITPSVSEEMAKLQLDSELAQTLGKVRALATRVSLGGSLDEPKCRVWSNLGPAVAEAMDRALAQTARGYTRQVLAESQQRVDERLAELDREIARQQSAAESRLLDASQQVRALADDAGPEHRLSVEYLGRQLPADSLFR